mmetsp:Transcript_13001/g.15779  ORF Transcript_13001/g.15779 Transcript_13001/m.15779 type:complete len:122 (-) Transcript_13001:1375-1740(-)
MSKARSLFVFVAALFVATALGAPSQGPRAALNQGNIRATNTGIICAPDCHEVITETETVCVCPNEDEYGRRRLSMCGSDCKAVLTETGWMCDCSDVETDVPRKLSSHNDACCNSITKTCCN